MPRYKHRRGPLTSADLLEYEIGFDTTIAGKPVLIIGDGSGGTMKPTSESANKLLNTSFVDVATTDGSLDLTVAGDVYAGGSAGTGTFHGTATTAKYADLAENYESDKAYEAGTVLFYGLDTEVSIDGDVYIGIVSDKPGYLLNSNPDYEFITPIALTGRVPLKVTGDIKRGNVLIIDRDIVGFAKVGTTSDVGTADYIGRCITASENGICEVKI